MKALSFGATCLVAFALASCGGSSQEPAIAEESSPQTAATAEPAPTEEQHALPPAPEAWSDDLTDEQKAAFMVERVMPAMKPVFAQAPEFTCATCHGKEQVEKKHFHHPNEALPRLTFENGAITSFQTNPDVSKFMAEKVLPAMAQVMGKPLMSKEQPSGMGCNGCHGVDMK